MRHKAVQFESPQRGGRGSLRRSVPSRGNRKRVRDSHHRSALAIGRGVREPFERGHLLGSTVLQRTGAPGTLLRIGAQPADVEGRVLPAVDGLIVGMRRRPAVSTEKSPSEPDFQNQVVDRTRSSPRWRSRARRCRLSPLRPSSARPRRPASHRGTKFCCLLRSLHAEPAGERRQMLREEAALWYFGSSLLDQGRTTAPPAESEWGLPDE